MKIDPKNLEWKEAHELLVSTVMPRPIAFVSTISEDGVLNVAPFSFFAAVATKPMLVGFTTGWEESGQKKDTLVNIEFSKDFVVCKYLNGRLLPTWGENSFAGQRTYLK